MQVLHVTCCVGGGVPQAISDHIASTPELDHHLLWPVGNGDSPAATVHPLATGRRRQRSQLARLVAQLDPDVIVAHSSIAGALVRTSRCATPVIYAPHGYAFADPSRPRAARALYLMAERALGRRCDAVLALSENEQRLARRTRPRAVTIVPNVSRATIASPKRAATGRTVAMAGRFASAKDPAFYAAVARTVRRTRPDIEFTWVGGGDDPNVSELLAEAGVQVSGWLPQTGCWERIAAADLYLHSSKVEGFPLTVLDAAALGVPILVRDIDAFSSLLGPKPATVEEMADAVIEFFDRPEASSAPARSVQVAAEHSPAVQAAKLRSLYRSVAAPRT